MTEDRKSGLSRRDWLRQTGFGGAALVVGGGASLLTTAAQAKVAPAMAKYQTSPKDGKKCSGCGQFKAPNACTVVDGDISPEGWCQFFVAKAG